MTDRAVAASAVLERLRTEGPALYEVWQSDPLREDDPTPPREVQRFGHIVVEAYRSNVRDEVPVLFGLVEGILQGDDPDVRHVVAQDLLETIQTVATHHDFGQEAFQPYLGPNSQRAWSHIERLWTLAAAEMPIPPGSPDVDDEMLAEMTPGRARPTSPTSQTRPSRSRRSSGS